MRGRVAFALLCVIGVGQAAAEGLDEQAAAAITQYRQQHGLSAVTADPRLKQLALDQARAMARADVLDHSVANSFQVRLASYNPDVAVENIAAGTRDFSATLAMWKRSAGHNANLLRNGATRFGIASIDAPQSRYKMYWALIMAAPHAPRATKQASAPGLMRAAPTEGRVVRARTQTARRASRKDNSDVFSSLARTFRALWQGLTASAK